MALGRRVGGWRGSEELVGKSLSVELCLLLSFDVVDRGRDRESMADGDAKAIRAERRVQQVDIRTPRSTADNCIRNSE